MASRQPLQIVDTNTENATTTSASSSVNNNVTSVVYHQALQRGIGNASDAGKTCASRGAGKASRPGRAYAPARLSRPLRNHFSDVVAEVIENSANRIVSIIEERKYDSNYDTHYAVEIMTYMKKLELRKRLPKDYLLNQTARSLNPRNRAIIIDWLIQVQHYLKLKQETLYLTINIFDHFFVKVLNVSTDKLQLVAITCILIASKIEERFTPEFSILLHLTDNAYSNSHLLQMERLILSTLGFQLVMPDPMVFLNRCCQATPNNSKQVENLSTFLIDTLLPDVKMCRNLLPSQIAAAAFCLARKLLVRNEVTWGEALEHYSGYKEVDMKETMIWMLCAVSESDNTKCELRGARTKYSSKSTYQNLSGLPVLTSRAIMKIIEVWTGSEPRSGAKI